MPYRIPSDEDIAKAVTSCINEYGIINSQRKLGELVRQRIKDIQNDYSVSDRRVRMVAIAKNLVDLELKYKEGGEGKLPHKCPICGSKLKRLKNMTIYGGTVTLGYSCSNCRYWTGLRKNIPSRYVFASRH
ncbi:MAG: hypothetical protein J9259_06770 [Thermoplasmata archaeon YP2-bin.285]|uniref:Uncharacterized protein n=2 Tax=Candidatus Sysuiplasma superficiale TaxID=2823368 RepID=A0A8J8CG26_9ARCH|nr:hypothetical protein [Candidatus Sysuiplasma superficiale]